MTDQTVDIKITNTPKLDDLQAELDRLQRDWRNSPQDTESFHGRGEDYVNWAHTVLIRRRREFQIRDEMVRSEQIVRCSHLTISALIGAREYAKIIADRWETMMIEQGISILQ